MKNLVIVESPAKAKTIEGFLGKDYVVKSSYGHIRDLSKKQLGVDVDNDFAPRYEISEDKVSILKELQKLASQASMVWLASDEDREGEAIAWHLFEALSLKEETSKRIAFHEITKDAITNAIANPRKINKNLVDAQQARRILDRLVGFEISPLLWKKVKPSLSAGRVQSVAVRLIVEREEEINKFNSTFSYKVNALFNIIDSDKNNVIKAELSKKFKTEEDAIAFLNHCSTAEFSIENIETKPAKKSPSAPFTTSTLQQEASRKLGFPVAKTMTIAQKLYEEGKITYMRTDSVNLSNLAIASAKKEITELYGNKYSKTRKYITKTKQAQEAHEAIRPTYIANKTIDGDKAQKSLYELIWKRTVASQMSDAELERTIITISISNYKENFIAKGEVILFDGFLKLYMESTDDEDNNEDESSVLPKVSKGDKLKYDEILAIQKFTQQAPRYTEASLVRKLEELGIGRPSTYAPTISTIQKREYVIKGDRQGFKREFATITLKNSKITTKTKTENIGFEKSKLFPTDIGIVVNTFLVEYFRNIVDYNFTAKVEMDFDEIAQGAKVWNEMIKEFYMPFINQVKHTLENADKAKGERLLGVDPKTGHNVYAKIGRFGPMIQIGESESEEKPKFTSLQKNQTIATITLDDALKLFEYPRLLGVFENSDITVGVGRFGPFIKHQSKYYSIPTSINFSEIELNQAIELINEKRIKDSEKVINSFNNNEISVLNGRFGPYITKDKVNYKIPKSVEPKNLTYDDCIKIISNEGSKPKTTRKKTIKK